MRPRLGIGLWWKRKANRQRIAITRRGVMLRRIQLFKSLKANEPCADCGKCYPHYIMQFDHLVPVARDNRYNLTTLFYMGRISGFLAEAMLCDIVCANCHCKRTWDRRENAKTKH